jgi:hypothetical protein
VHGSGALTRWLLENDLVDEFAVRAFEEGITVQVYRPAGRQQYAE